MKGKVVRITDAELLQIAREEMATREGWVRRRYEVSRADLPFAIHHSGENMGVEVWEFRDEPFEEVI